MSNVGRRLPMQLATLVCAKSFEAAIVGRPDLVATFKNTSEGIERFQSWALQTYHRGTNIEILLWEAEQGVASTPFAEQASAGKVEFRSPLPWRSADGLVSVSYVGHSSAVELCRRFGYEGVQLEAVIRRANGEFPSLKPAA